MKTLRSLWCRYFGHRWVLVDKYAYFFRCSRCNDGAYMGVIHPDTARDLRGL